MLNVDSQGIGVGGAGTVCGSEHGLRAVRGSGTAPHFSRSAFLIHKLATAAVRVRVWGDLKWS